VFGQIRKTVEKYNMLNLHDRVLIGVSGGPDSVILLLALNQLKNDYKLTLKVAHVDHLIRGEDSHQDMEFVKSLCNDLGIDFCFREVDIKKIVEVKKDSIEKIARVARYDFFKEIAINENFTKIAVGHNSDDQAETILMRIIRGTGLLGLKGIPAVRNISPDLDILLIRPLIEVSSSDIREYLDKENISYRKDYTNQEQIFLRNKVRHHLLPILEEYNPNIKQLLLNMSYSLLGIQDYVNKEGRRRYRSTAVLKGDDIIIDLRRFSRFHTAIKREIFRNTIRQLKGNLKKITYQHWREFQVLVDERPIGSVVDFPFGVKAKKIKRKIIFYKVVKSP